MIDRVAAELGRTLSEVPVGFKWFVPGLLRRVDRLRRRGVRRAPRSCGATGRCGPPTRTGSSWRCWPRRSRAGPAGRRASTTPSSPSGTAPRRTPASTPPPTGSRRRGSARCRPRTSPRPSWRGSRSPPSSPQRPGNGAPIGGLKVTTESAWFAARPSGTEDVYKIYAESFRGPDHLAEVQDGRPRAGVRCPRRPEPRLATVARPCHGGDGPRPDRAGGRMAANEDLKAKMREALERKQGQRPRRRRARPQEGEGPRPRHHGPLGGRADAPAQGRWRRLLSRAREESRPGARFAPVGRAGRIGRVPPPCRHRPGVSMQFGRSYEEFEVGATYKHWPGKTVTEYDDHLFCLLTMNHHPLHLDVQLRRGDDPVRQERRGRQLRLLDPARHVGPRHLRQGDRQPRDRVAAPRRPDVPRRHACTARPRVLDKWESKSKDDRGVVHVETIGYNQDGKVVCIFRRKVMVPKETTWRRAAASSPAGRCPQPDKNWPGLRHGRPRPRRRSGWSATARPSGAAPGSTRRSPTST